MKPILISVSFAMFSAALPAAMAAEGAAHRFEWSGVPPSGSAALKRDPVTFLGVAVAPAPAVLSAQLKLPDGHGLVVQLVEPDSPAAKAGLQPYDLLTRFQDQVLIEPRQLSVLVRGRKAGETVTLTYLRGGEEARVDVTLGSHVPSLAAGVSGSFGAGAPADVMVHHTRVLGPHDLAATPGTPVHHPLPAPGSGFGGGDRALDRVMIFRPLTSMVFSDETGTLTMQVDEQGRNLMARDPTGAVTFSGPVNTPEQRAALPDELRERLEKFESLDVLEHRLPEPGGQPDVRSLPRLDRGSAGSPVM